MFSSNTSQVSVAVYRYWRLQNTSYGSESVGVSVAEWQITTSDNSISSLVGYTLTNLGGAFLTPSFPMSNVNNGNTSDIGYVQNTSGFFDIYVDLGSGKNVTAYKIAPQGGPYNTPTDFIVKASNDASTWTTIATFTGISTGSSNWTGGTYRTFSW
jgi:hypothetical protein